MDDLSRKQLLLTRIAIDRAELRASVVRVRQAVGVPWLLRAVIGADLGRALLGAGSSGGADWLRAGLALLRRYRWAAALVSGVAPLLGSRRPGRNGWRRVIRLGALGVAAWFGWRALRNKGRTVGIKPDGRPVDASR